MTTIVRCPWARTPEYEAYHDTEWGVPLHGDDSLFERLALEAFQSGLSWRTILYKRPAFRMAFAGFSISRVAEFDDDDVERLLLDASIVRNRRKIEATIHNARVAAAMSESLDDVMWSFAPRRAKLRPQNMDDVPAVTEESSRMAKELKRRGFVFVGPTTAYALMQATGMVDDHVTDCFRASAKPRSS